MKNRRTVFKVVRLEKNGMFSALPTNQLQYEMKKWTKPKIVGSRLFLFNQLKWAEEYIGDSSIHKPHRAANLLILECIAIKPSPQPFGCFEMDSRAILKFWEQKEYNPLDCMVLAEGTYSADGIMPLKIVP